MRIPRLLAVALLAFLVSACSSKPQDMIVGKWQGKQQEGGITVDLTIEYNKDGTLKASGEAMGMKMEGTGKYKFLDDNNVEQEITMMNKTQKEKVKVAFNKDKMTQTDEKGKSVEFTKAK
jgi:uncharacterized protein (TIGR03066 family)